MGSVGGPYLPQDGSTPLHDIGNAEGPSNLDQLPPGDDDLLSLGKCVEHQQDCSGIIVHDQGGFSSRQSAENPLDVGIP